ncbi:class I SAM-dependent methyltransferase [Actinospica sp. MGRD01-02]|uniref:Class I SAM-dependent methyltransferase n=1 Tax=Actinospica acidithermotolerans TaxID=2828514 RepID=A0A941EGN4_9ACTN|nr:class I SAM-dependent methyltransferase [Actinospica acidithermotolerans]MBR7830275.1 class I SAM-dependent methyltransferase [Actinospica acidithermotolerans]
MDADWLGETRTSYDTVAESYAAQTRDALGGAPFLQAALKLFADTVPPGGPVADVGCGPGHITAHLHSFGLNAFGLDLSPAMAGLARREHPEAEFAVGSMTALGLADESVAGLLAFWSLIHIPDDAVPGVLAEFHRVLRPDAPVLVGFHLGDGSRLKKEGYGGHPMNVYVHRRPAERMAAWLDGAGFTVTAHMLVGLDTRYPGGLLFARRNPPQERSY